MTLDIQKMKEIASNLHSAAANKHFGLAGPQALRELVEIITQIYRLMEPATRSVPLVVFIRPSPSLLPASQCGPQALHQVAHISGLQHELDSACMVEVSSAGQVSVFDLNAHNLVALSAEAIVYLYDNGHERFYIGGESYTVINPAAPTHASVFARPTFSSLSDALEGYRNRVARYTSCYILKDAWREPRRIFLRTKPEATMRRSLLQHLASTIGRFAEVRPEQIVDESHPVDIKVTWVDTNQRALIEIKWLGQSCEEDGTFTTAYTASRARDGAKQLAEYLDANLTAGPGLRSRGYLVVFDARRRGLHKGATSLSVSDGLHYRDEEIDYNPKYHEQRDDFEAPVRMFCEPIVS